MPGGARARRARGRGRAITVQCPAQVPTPATALEPFYWKLGLTECVRVGWQRCHGSPVVSRTHCPEKALVFLASRRGAIWTVASAQATAMGISPRLRGVHAWWMHTPKARHAQTSLVPFQGEGGRREARTPPSDELPLPHPLWAIPFLPKGGHLQESPGAGQGALGGVRRVRAGRWPLESSGAPPRAPAPAAARRRRPSRWC